MTSVCVEAIRLAILACHEHTRLAAWLRAPYTCIGPRLSTICRQEGQPAVRARLEEDIFFLLSLGLPKRSLALLLTEAPTADVSPMVREWS